MHITSRRRLALPAIVLAAAIALTGLASLRAVQPAYALTNCTVSDNSFDAEEAAFLTLINNYRAQNGLQPLTISTNLNRAASWLAVDMGTKGYFSHTDSLGRSPSTRAQNCDYPGGAGENIAAGTVKDTAAEAFEMWRNSSGHNANMLNSGYKTIGIARAYVAGSPYSWYWVTDFGLVLDGTGGGATATPTRTATAIPPTATRTATAIPPTATRTSTAIPPTATRTSTAIPPTATRTSTAIQPTATRTSTAIPPTATRTATAIPPTATATRTTTPSLVKAAITTPAPGSTLPGSSATFNWTTGSGALEYFIYAGSTQGSNNYFGRSAGLSTSMSVTNLPTNGSTVHVRLWTRFSTGWQVTDYTYTAASTTTTFAKAAMTSPAPGSRLGTSATFTWSTGTGATEYFLYVGTSPGSATYYAASTGTTRTATVSGLPRDGRTLYVRLWTRLGRTWQYTDYAYLAATR